MRIGSPVGRRRLRDGHGLTCAADPLVDPEGREGIGDVVVVDDVPLQIPRANCIERSKGSGLRFSVK
jgi:hypothetical protein